MAQRRVAHARMQADAWREPLRRPFASRSVVARGLAGHENRALLQPMSFRRGQERPVAVRRRGHGPAWMVQALTIMDKILRHTCCSTQVHAPPPPFALYPSLRRAVSRRPSRCMLCCGRRSFAGNHGWVGRATPAQGRGSGHCRCGWASRFRKHRSNGRWDRRLGRTDREQPDGAVRHGRLHQLLRVDFRK